MAGGDNNFFNELNWFDTATGQSPEIGSIDPFEAINFDLNLTCNAVASSISGLGVSISSQSPEFSTLDQMKSGHLYLTSLV